MIDSIQLRIHNLEVHSRLVDLLHKKGVEGQSSYFKEMDGGDITRHNLQKRVHFHHFFTDHLNGNTVESNYRNYIKSHAYDLAYSINFVQGFIELNFSVPKYLYGTNIFQFVPHSNDDDYMQYYSCDEFSEMMNSVYSRLKKFILWFFDREFNLKNIALWEVQLSRVDFTYNKVFSSYDDSKMHLEDMKRIKKKYIRDTSDKKTIYDSSVYISLPDYTTKIYQKGIEFRLHDRKQLLKRGASLALVEDLQKLADRTLRYEVEMKNGMMDRLFKQFLFRPESDQYQQCYSIFKSIRSNGYMVDSKGQKIDQLKMSRSQKAMYRYAKHIDNKTFNFYLESDTAFHVDTSDQDHEIFEKTKNQKFEYQMRFSKRLFRLLFKKFKSEFDQFNVAYAGDIIDLITTIEKNNYGDSARLQAFAMHCQMKGDIPKELVEHNISWRSIKNCATFLKTYTWDDYKIQGVVSERQYYRMRKLFRLLGILNPASEIVPTTDNNFKEYYWAVSEIEGKYDMRETLRSLPF